MKRRALGFSLIELMIAVAIAGIIAAIAYPAYMSSIRKSNRTEAKTELMDIVQRLQRCYTTYGKFNDVDKCSVYKDLDDGGILSRGKNFYQITISNASATTYTLTATAVSEPQLSDSGCTVLTVDETGITTPAANCW